MSIVKHLFLIFTIIVFTSCSDKSSKNTEPNTPTTPITNITNSITDKTIKPTANDYIKAGITGVDNNNIDSVNSFISSLSSSSLVDTKAKIQTVVDNIAIITSITKGIVTPSLENYQNIGIEGVTAQNIVQINNILKDKTATAISTKDKIQAIINSFISKAIIVASVTSTTIIPLAKDYTNIGVTKVDTNNITDVNKIVKDNNITDKNTTSQIQILVDTVNARITILGLLNNNTTNPTATQYTLLGILGVTSRNINDINTAVKTANPKPTDLVGITKIVETILAKENIQNLTTSSNTFTPRPKDYALIGVTDVTEDNVNLINSNIKELAPINVQTTSQIQNIVDGVILKISQFIKKIQDYANGRTSTVPTIFDYNAMGIINVSTSNIDDINRVITTKISVSIDSITKIQNIINTLDQIPPKIFLKGSNLVTLELNEPYVEQGVRTTDNIDTNVSVKIIGEVNISKVGNYVLIYEARDDFSNTNTTKRTVGILDRTPPTITLKGKNPIYVIKGTTYIEPNATIFDYGDKNITLVITGSVDTTTSRDYNLTYNATDKSGNKAISKVRTVKVQDKVNPSITFVTPIITEYGVVYNDTGVAFSSNIIGASLVTQSRNTSQVNSNIIGDYNVTYYAKDSLGFETSATRLVQVRDRVIPVISLRGPPIVYLVQGDTYPEYSASVNDNHDAFLTITGNLVINSTRVDTSTIGDYNVTYNVSDSSGNKAVEVNRTVRVLLNNPPRAIAGADKNITEGDKINLGVSQSNDIDGSITKYYWFEGNRTIYSGTTPPTKLPPLSIGTHNLGLVVTDNHEINSTETNESNMTIIVKIGIINLKKTEQNISYTAYDDGYYQAGFDNNYTTVDNNVTDNKTGLIWSKIDSKPSTNYDADMKYFESVVNGGFSATYSLDSSFIIYPDVCKVIDNNKTSLWRIPTRVELMGLLDYGDSSIDGNFTVSTSRGYWTKTQDVSTTNNQWSIGFATSSKILSLDLNSSKKYVRCLNDKNIITPKDKNYTKTSFTVIDNNIMLEWQDNNTSSDYNWTDAIKFCKDLNLSNVEGISWRLPNIRELNSIVDDNKSNPSIDGNFTNTSYSTSFPSVKYWTSTTDNSSTNQARLVEFYKGATSSLPKNEQHRVRCVRTRREPSFYIP